MYKAKSDIQQTYLKYLAIYDKKKYIYIYIYHLSKFVNLIDSIDSIECSLYTIFLSHTMSILLSRVIRALEKIAPLSLAESSWDNVGLLVEPPYPRPNSSRVFLTIDLTSSVLEEALADPKVGVIVAYHPPIFRSFKRLNLSDIKQAIVLTCAAKGIGVFSPHTALDSCVGGVNDWLSKALGDGTSKPITLAENPPTGHETAGSGRLFTLAQPAPLSTIIERIKLYLKLQHVRVATAERHGSLSNELISTVGICAGSEQP
ncbi:NGG1p interacting factor 3 [Gigaspora margarita]|uniref:NGG1p interacting factor 3 n=1 Tax=Gigaspora margarita TaxID=4874 RepID=A0A8H4AZE6_GIGMA|nr:NGG1p interacting factor 3 [Gigaspora margarita]